MLPCRCCQWCQIPLVQPPLKKYGRIQDLSGQRIMFRANGKTLKASGDYHQIPDTKFFFLGGGDDVSKCKPSNLAVFVKRSVWKLDTCERSCMEYWTSTPMYAEFVRTTLAREGFLLVFWGEVLADLMSVVCHWWKNYEHSLLKLPVDPICQYAFFKEASNNVIRGNKKMCNISQTLRIFFCRQKLGGISPMVFVWRIDMVCKN